MIRAYDISRRHMHVMLFMHNNWHFYLTGSPTDLIYFLTFLVKHRDFFGNIPRNVSKIISVQTFLEILQRTPPVYGAVGPLRLCFSLSLSLSVYLAGGRRSRETERRRQGSWNVNTVKFVAMPTRNE